MSSQTFCRMWGFEKALRSLIIVPAVVNGSQPSFIHHLHSLPGPMLDSWYVHHLFSLKGGSITWPMLPILQIQQMGFEARSVWSRRPCFRHIVLLQKKKDEKAAVLFSVNGKMLDQILPINPQAPKCLSVIAQNKSYTLANAAGIKGSSLALPASQFILRRESVILLSDI